MLEDIAGPMSLIWTVSAKITCLCGSILDARRAVEMTAYNEAGSVLSVVVLCAACADKHLDDTDEGLASTLRANIERRTGTNPGPIKIERIDGRTFDAASWSLAFMACR